MRVYLAGPMRGIEQFNFPAFHEAAAQMRALGHEVISPAEHDLELGFDPTLNSLDGFDMEAAMRWDVAQVLTADVVYLLAGWESSEGVAVELAVAKAIGVPIQEIGRTSGLLNGTAAHLERESLKPRVRLTLRPERRRRDARSSNELLEQEGPLRRVAPYLGGGGWVLLECGHDIYRPAAQYGPYRRTRCPACRDGGEAPEGQRRRALAALDPQEETGG
ncbi:MAG: DUF4406 domain-containing protein [Candidatus Dormibacteria bacterium]